MSSSTSDIQVRSLKVDNFLQIASDKQLRFRDTGIYITSLDDGYLDLIADLGVRINPLTRLGIQYTLASDHTVGASARIVENQTAGQDLVFGDTVYLKLSDSKWWKTDADATATSIGKLGFVTETIATDATGDIMIEGTARDDSWTWTTTGSSLPLFVSTTPGGLQEAVPGGAGDVVRVAAHSLAANVIEFKPDSSWVEV